MFAAVCGVIAGLPLGFIYSLVLVQVLATMSPATVNAEFMPQIRMTWWVDILLIIGQIVPFGLCLFVGLHEVRHRSLLGPFLLAAGIAAAFPATTCTIGLLVSR